MTVRERLFILRVIRHGDADAIVHVLNMQGAKLSLFARSALRSKKRFGGGVLEPTHYIEALYRPGREAGAERRLGVLQEAALIEDFAAIRQDYDRLQLAFYVLDVVSRISQEGTQDGGDIFNLLGNTLRAIATNRHLERLRTHFEIKVLNYQGILPVLENAENFLRVSTQDCDKIEMKSHLWPQFKQRVHEALHEYISR